MASKMVYGIASKGKFKITGNKTEATKYINKNGGKLYAMPYKNYKGLSWDIPTFKSMAKVILEK